MGPISEYNRLCPPERAVEIEPALVDAVVREVAAGRVDLGRSGRGGVDGEVDEGRIEAPYLQLVLERLWEEETNRESRVCVSKRCASSAERRGSSRTTWSGRCPSCPPTRRTPQRRCTTISSLRPGRRSRMTSRISPATRSSTRTKQGGCSGASPTSGSSVPAVTAAAAVPGTRSSTTCSPMPCSHGGRGTRPIVAWKPSAKPPSGGTGARWRSRSRPGSHSRSSQ